MDQEVGLEMADLIFLFKSFNLGQNLNLNFACDFPPLPKGIIEEMIEAYENEDTSAEKDAAAPEATNAADT